MEYNDYPAAAKRNAQRALDHRDENGSDCGTPVGWQRANQIAKGENLSEDTVKRTFSFLSRSKTYDTGSFFDSDGNEVCGSVMYAAWGGDAMKTWAERKIKAMEKEERLKKVIDAKRHVISFVETDEFYIVTFGKGEAMDDDDDMPEMVEDAMRLAPDEGKVGDYVSWNNSGGRAYGRITRTATDGQLEADSGFVVNATEDDPAALISVYEYDTDEAAYMERDPQLIVAHRFSTLQKESADKFRKYKDKEKKRSEDAGPMQNAMFRISRMDAMPDSREIRGYGIVFNSDSTPMHVFDEERGVVKVVERITKESIERADLSDMVATFNHNFDYILGRTSNSTMDVRIEDKGVFYSVKPSKTSYADDLLENLRAGNITGSSFYFSMDSEQGYDFKERADGMLEATPKRITKVYEMGPVTSPAYPATTSERRSMLHDQAEAFLKQKRTAQEAEQTEEPAMTEDEQKLRAFYERKKYKKLKGA